MFGKILCFFHNINKVGMLYRHGKASAPGDYILDKFIKLKKYITNIKYSRKSAKSAENDFIKKFFLALCF